MSIFKDIDRQLAEILAAVAAVNDNGEDHYHHLQRRLTTMDARFQKLADDLAAYVAKVTAYVTAMEGAKVDVAAAVADAVAKDNAAEDVDIAALDAAVSDAFAKVPDVPPAAPVVTDGTP